MQREIFLKFIAKLKNHCEIVLIGSEIDYRRLIAQSSIDQVSELSVLITLSLSLFPTFLVIMLEEANQLMLHLDLGYIIKIFNEQLLA